MSLQEKTQQLRALRRQERVLHIFTLQLMVSSIVSNPRRVISYLRATQIAYQSRILLKTITNCRWWELVLSRSQLARQTLGASIRAPFTAVSRERFQRQALRPW